MEDDWIRLTMMSTANGLSNCLTFVIMLRLDLKQRGVPTVIVQLTEILSLKVELNQRKGSFYRDLNQILSDVRIT
jgi:hypothetical protein